MGRRSKRKGGGFQKRRNVFVRSTEQGKAQSLMRLGNNSTIAGADGKMLNFPDNNVFGGKLTTSDVASMVDAP